MGHAERRDRASRRPRPVPAYWRCRGCGRSRLIKRGAFVIFHGLVSADSDGPVEVCVPVTHLPEDPAELAWRVEPPHHEAFIQVTRVHFEAPAILSVYDQLTHWVSVAGRKQIGSPREVYTPVSNRYSPPPPRISAMLPSPLPSLVHHRMPDEYETPNPKSQVIGLDENRSLHPLSRHDAACH
jgi:hypothetical protein